MRKFVRFAGVALAALLAVGALLYAFGLRVQIYGGGTPRLAFVSSPEDREAVIARHRDAQRASTPVPAEVPPVPAPAAPAEPLSTPAAAPPAQPAAATWPDFLGPARDGHFRARPILATWPATGLEPIWKQPAGGGYASFVVAQGRAFTIEQRGPREVVAAYDVATGRELWTNEWTALFSESMGGDGPRATPTWFDGRLHALGGAGEFRTIDAASGRTIWRTNILDDAGATNLQWGMAAAPLVVDDNVVVLPGGSNGRSVVAYDRISGKRTWSALDDKQAYSSPMLVTLLGVRQILVFSASRLMGLSPEDRTVLWEYPWKTDYDVNASQPVLVGDNRVFVSTGYGAGAAVIELAQAGNRFSVREVWRNIRMKNQFTTSLLHDGHIYGLDQSILTCLDGETGVVKWKGGRYGFGQVALAGGHLVVLGEDGTLALVRATPERHEELATFQALEGKTWNHPAFADGILLVRNSTEMAAFDLRVK